MRVCCLLGGSRMLTQLRCPAILSFCMSTWIGLACSAAPASGDDSPTSAPSLAALEGALVDAIAKAEDSVVAIAKIKRADSSIAGRLEPRFNPFAPIQRLPNIPE